MIHSPFYHLINGEQTTPEVLDSVRIPSYLTAPST